jgi:hypothetical protein
VVEPAVYDNITGHPLQMVDVSINRSCCLSPDGRSGGGYIKSPPPPPGCYLSALGSAVRLVSGCSVQLFFSLYFLPANGDFGQREIPP